MHLQRPLREPRCRLWKSFSGFDTPHPYTLFLPQDTTERLLEEQLLEDGVAIARVLVEQTQQDDDSVTVAARATAPRSACVRYLIGADGGRNLVRQRAGIAFDGVAATSSMLMGDVRLRHPPASPMLSLTNAAGSLMIVPLGQGRHRVIAMNARHPHAAAAPAATVEELAQASTAIAEHDFGLHDACWLSRFSDETRLARRYRQGHRVFLAGDAAHPHAGRRPGHEHGHAGRDEPGLEAGRRAQGMRG